MILEVEKNPAAHFIRKCCSRVAVYIHVGRFEEADSMCVSDLVFRVLRIITMRRHW